MPDHRSVFWQSDFHSLGGTLSESGGWQATGMLLFVCIEENEGPEGPLAAKNGQFSVLFLSFLWGLAGPF
jgi:hypothetical protein